MGTIDETDREDNFLSQAGIFVERMLQKLGAVSLDCLPPIQSHSTALQPTIISDPSALTIAEKSSLVEQYQSPYGVAYFAVLCCPNIPAQIHPLLAISEQLRSELNLNYPLPHPLEDHPDIVGRFGRDGTLKVYDVGKREAGYREQGETSEDFHIHHDGLGSGGTVQTVALYLDSPPFSGGFTYFLNLCRVALELARTDSQAFKDLFRPDAMTVVRPRGKGAISVVSPVLFINEHEEPQSLFRTPSGEYQIRFNSKYSGLSRAITFLNRFSSPFAPASSFVHFSAKGHGCFIQNEIVAHGRTAFLNIPDRVERVLARKWYMRSERDATYKHVPGIFISPRFAHLHPEYFGTQVLQGEWRLENGENIRIR